ncbi:MAG: hypothetical protein IH631_03690 [Candidatus Thorarchaeota archaeon]|nr:hypothetical protein [Candidatus Thorarchaeota archaeon]
MLLIYALVGAFVLSVLSYGYGYIVEPRHTRKQKTGRREYPDLWIEGLLDCEYSPTKQSYGPARIMPVDKVKLMPASRGCEDC